MIASDCASPTYFSFFSLLPLQQGIASHTRLMAIALNSLHPHCFTTTITPISPRLATLRNIQELRSRSLHYTTDSVFAPGGDLTVPIPSGVENECTRVLMPSDVRGWGHDDVFSTVLLFPLPFLPSRSRPHIPRLRAYLFLPPEIQ